jgi:hypothetical protein
VQRTLAPWAPHSTWNSGLHSAGPCRSCTTRYLRGARAGRQVRQRAGPATGGGPLRGSAAAPWCWGGAHLASRLQGGRATTLTTAP